jgi:hypothetical protein
VVHRPGCASIRPHALARTAPATLAELRAAIDAGTDEEAIHQLLERLGAARVERDADAARISRRRYATWGLDIEARQVDSIERITSVELQGRSDGSFAGALPEGLSFQMNVEDAFAALGQPDEKRLRTYAWAPHYYRARGLALRFDQDGCLGSVAFVAAIPARRVRFDDVVVTPHRMEEGLSGVAIDFTRAVGEVPTPSVEMRIRAELVDARGAALHQLDEAGADVGPMRAEIVDFAQGELRRSLFVPFAGMKLPRGPAKLHASLHAWIAEEGKAVELEGVAPAAFDVSFEMPLLHSARFGVKRVEVEPGVYDGSSSVNHFSRPDLRWRVSHGSRREGVSFVSFFTSEARQDTFVARWKEQSRPFVVAPDDQLTLCVEDEDVLVEENIGCFGFTLDRAREEASAARPLQRGKIRALVLAPPKVKPIN